MAQIVSSKCPHCGAPLSVPPQATEVVCAYCQHTSLIQRPNAPVRVPTAERPVIQIDARGASSALTAVFVAIGVAALGVVTSVVVFSSSAAGLSDIVKKSDTSGVLGSLASAAKPRFYFSDQPFLLDVNGDGVLDVLGKSNVPGGTAWLAAYDGKSGDELWKSADLPKDAADAGAFRALAGETLISVDTLGKMQATNAKNGQPLWAALLGETARDACAGDGFVQITKSDRATVAVDLTNGKPFGGSTRGSCHAIPTSGKSSGVGYRIVGWSDFDDWGIPGLHSVEGLSAHRALVLEDKSMAFLLGAKSSGTQIAMVAGVQGKKVLWQDVVPGVDPMTTDVNVTTQMAAYADGRLVIPYHLRDSNGGVRMAAFDTKTGKRLWDMPVHQKTQADGGLALTSTDVFFGSWTALYVLDAATGKRKFVVGTEF